MFNFGRQYMRNMWLSACVCVYWVYIEGFLRLTCRSLYLYVSTSQNQRFPFFFISFNSCCYFFFFLFGNQQGYAFFGWLRSGRWHQAQVGKHPLPTSVSNLTGNLELPKRMINHLFRIILTFFFFYYYLFFCHLIFTRLGMPSAEHRLAFSNLLPFICCNKARLCQNCTIMIINILVTICSARVYS